MRKKENNFENVELSKLDFLNVLESAWRNSARSEALTAIHYKDCCLLVSVTACILLFHRNLLLPSLW